MPKPSKKFFPPAPPECTSARYVASSSPPRINNAAGGAATPPLPARYRRRGAILLWTAMGIGCGNPIPQAPRDASAAPYASGGSSAPTEPTSISFEPASAVDQVGQVFRVTLQFEAAVNPLRAALFAGDVSAAQLRAFAKGDLSKALASRQVPALAWQPSRRDVVVLQPLGSLEPAETYTMVLDSPSYALTFHVSNAQTMPLLPRVWPLVGDAVSGKPAGDSVDATGAASDLAADEDTAGSVSREPAANDVATREGDADGSAAVDESPGDANAVVIYCADGPLGLMARDEAFEPGHRSGRWSPGVGAEFDVPSCIRWTATEPSMSDDLLLPPPAVTFDDGSRAMLESIAVPVRHAPMATPAECSPQELPFGLGCAEAQDDRVVVRPPAAPLLWAFEEAPIHRSALGRPFVMRRTGVAASLRFAALDGANVLWPGTFVWPEREPRAHVVVSEVYADPLGPEPSQEWIELFNDGSTAVVLGGYRLQDASGETVLPDSTLNQGEYALIVPTSFLRDDGVDAPVPSSVLLLHVPEIGKGGLSNAGEAIVLRDALGAELSRFPAIRARPGVSMARLGADALDDDPNAFGPSSNGSSTPGAPNR